MSQLRALTSSAVSLVSGFEADATTSAETLFASFDDAVERVSVNTVGLASGSQRGAILVLRTGSRDQMGRIAALSMRACLATAAAFIGIVAGVIKFFTLRNRSSQQLKGKAMSANGTIIHPKLSIAITIKSPHPNPTVIRLLDTLPKAFFGRGVRVNSLWHRTILSVSTGRAVNAAPSPYFSRSWSPI